MKRELCLLLLAASAGACTEGSPVSIEDATGSIIVEAYLDRDGDGERGDADVAAPGVRAAVVRTQSGDTVVASTTGADGSVLLTGIPVGTLRLVADRGSLGDSVDVHDIDDAVVTVTVADTARRVVRIGYINTSVTIEEARTLAAGSPVAVTGIALNATATFGDSTLHLQDASGAIRGIRATTGVAAGDSVRILGTITSRDGQPAIDVTGTWILQAGIGSPDPDSVSTAVAAAAEGGARDAGQVLVRGEIVGTQPEQNGDLVLLVNDGSGPLEVVLDANVAFGSGPFLPGAELRAGGVLVSSGTGTWQLKPRSSGELSATLPTLTIAQARALAPGRSAYIQGYALNGRATFTDGAVHVYDATGAIRVQQLPNTQVLQGDSVRVMGTVSNRLGQPILEGSQVVVLLAGVGLDEPDSVSTASAAAATGAASDADHVTVAGTVSAVGTTSGGWLLTVSDGSGSLQIMLDSRVGFSAADFAVDDVVRASGVLVPVSTGVWQLKPRTLDEITAQ